MLYLVILYHFTLLLIQICQVGARHCRAPTAIHMYHDFCELVLYIFTLRTLKLFLHLKPAKNYFEIYKHLATFG